MGKAARSTSGGHQARAGLSGTCHGRCSDGGESHRSRSIRCRRRHGRTRRADHRSDARLDREVLISVNVMAHDAHSIPWTRIRVVVRLSSLMK